MRDACEEVIGRVLRSAVVRIACESQRQDETRDKHQVRRVRGLLCARKGESSRHE